MLAQDAQKSRSLEKILDRTYHRVIVAADAADATRILTGDPTMGIVVIDAEGSGRSASSLFRVLRRAVPPDRDLAPVFLGHSPNVNEVVRALRLGTVDFLRTPVRPADLLDAVGRAEAAHRRRTGAQESSRAFVAMAETFADLARKVAADVEAVPPAGLSDPDSRSPFTEPLDPHAAREDMASLPRQRRRRSLLAEIIKVRSLRRSMLGGDLSEPALDILLQIHADGMDGRPPIVSDIAAASAIPPTTTLRRLEELVGRGFVTRCRDGRDNRRIIVALTPKAESALDTFLDALMRMRIDAGGDNLPRPQQRAATSSPRRTPSSRLPALG